MSAAVVITGGMVSFEDGIKKSEEYAPPLKARVELKFDIAAGADEEAALQHVSRLAMQRVYDMLGADKKLPAAPKPTAPVSQPGASGGTGGQGTAEAAKPSGKKTTSVNKPKEPALKAPENDKEAAAAAAGLRPDLTPGNDAAAMDEFTVGGESEGEEDLTVFEAEPVSDAELNKAVQAKNKEIANPPAIRSLISKFNPDPAKQFTLAEMPQAQRRTFLKDLAALTKAA